jgi:hypothetical protein
MNWPGTSALRWRRLNSVAEEHFLKHFDLDVLGVLLT